MMLSNGCSHVVNGLMPRSSVCAPPPTRARFAETASKDPNQISYLIVRQTPGGPVKVQSSGMTELQPGDLVDIVMGAGDSAGRSQPDRNGPASKPNREVPIERVGRQESATPP